MSWCSNSGVAGRGRKEAGGTLLVALSTIAALSVVAGALTVSLTSRSQTAARAASWHDAMVAAESAAQVAIGEVRRVMPTVQDGPADAWAGWTHSAGTLPASKQVPAGVLSFTPPALVHAGEGSTTTTALVTVDAPATLAYPSGSAYRWLRVRSVGTAPLLGRGSPSLHKFDTGLRNYAFRRQRADLVGRINRAVAAPEVARSIEVIVRPVLAFEQALLSAGSFTNSSNSLLIDSYDSTSLLKSTLGLYDSSKQQRNGSAYTMGTNFPNNGRVYGDAGTNGGQLAANSSITGQVVNDYYRVLTPVDAPSWATSATQLNANATSHVLANVSASNPRRYRLSSFNGKLNISGAWPFNSYIEIYVAGDFRGQVKADAGVQVTIYAAGDVDVDAEDLDNRSYRAANLQIYGVQPPAGQTRDIEIKLGDDLYATVYAPSHNLKVTSNGHWFGSIVARSVAATGALKLHYDESLARRVGPIIDYKAASWIEDVR